MQHLSFVLIVILLGVGLTTVVDVIGSLISRLLNINYGYFALLSFVVYVTIAYLVAKETNRALLTMTIVWMIAFYDATVGWMISQRLKANYKVSQEVLDKMTLNFRLAAAILFAILCGLVGYFLGMRG